MKINKYLLLAIPLIFLLSCNSDSSLTKQVGGGESSNTSKDIEYSYTIKGNTSDEFSILIENNPIDAAYKTIYEDYDGSSTMIIENSAKCRDWWRLEMEVVYNRLLEVLDEEDSQNLLISQTSWEEYMKTKKSMEENFFYNNKYDTIGELRKALSVSEEAEETKARAYSLLEYLYIITGEINLVFTDD